MTTVDAGEWLACLDGDKESDGQQQVAAALAMIDNYKSDSGCSDASPAPASPIESVVDCTNTASEHGTDSSSSVGSLGPSLAPPLASPSDVSTEDRTAGQIARKNRARLYRYHRSKAELLGLQQEAVKLQAKLDVLLQNEELLFPATLETSPCPFVDDARDEIDPRERARPLAAPAPASASQCEVDWKGVAVREHKRRQRSQAVQRKLKRLLREYKSQTEAFTKDLLSTAGKPSVGSTRALPSLPGADSLEAFMYSGVAMLSELYHMACSACSITRTALVALSKSGGELAYSFLLGQEIESGWTHDFSFPGNDPSSVAALMVRAIKSQQPQNYVVREVTKHHNTVHPLSEWRFTMRHQRACGTPVELECAMMMQTFDADDNTVVVWTLSVHSGESSAPPVFRASGWSAYQRSLPGQITCRSSARVHCAPSHSLARVEKTVKRRPMINAWSSSIRAKQEIMSNRLLLVL